MFPVSRESWDQPQHGLNWDSERICPGFPLTRSHKNNKPKYVSAKHGAGSKNTHGDRDTRASTYTDSPPVLRKGPFYNHVSVGREMSRVSRSSAAWVWGRER